MKIAKYASILLIGIITLAILAPPVMAVSKTSLMAQYSAKPVINTVVTEDHTPGQGTSIPGVKEFVATIPPKTTVPPGAISSQFSSWMKVNTHDYSCPPDEPVGTLHQVDCLRLDPTGNLYGMAVDDVGRVFVIKEGCR